MTLLYTPLVVVLLVGWTDRQTGLNINAKTWQESNSYTARKRPLTSDLFDTLEGVFECT